jgi:hypothetical protein
LKVTSLAWVSRAYHVQSTPDYDAGLLVVVQAVTVQDLGQGAHQLLAFHVLAGAELLDVPSYQPAPDLNSFLSRRMDHRLDAQTYDLPDDPALLLAI